jgi:hypothetical protein
MGKQNDKSKVKAVLDLFQVLCIPVGRFSLFLHGASEKFLQAVQDQAILPVYSAATILNLLPHNLVHILIGFWVETFQVSWNWT